jgi:cytochrome c553
MKLKPAFLVAICLSAGLCTLARAADAPADADNAALKATLDTCATCHGARGQGVSPNFPNLAAQTVSYIEMQLRAFKDQSRDDPDAQAYMWGMATQLSDARITALAAYFSSLPAAPGHAGNSAQVTEGKRVYELGVPARGMPPCANCHGPHAEGLSVFPRLAGQHAPYLLKQMLVIQNVLRTAPVMHGLIKELTRDQMVAVATYLESI